MPAILEYARIIRTESMMMLTMSIKEDKFSCDAKTTAGLRSSLSRVVSTKAMMMKSLRRKREMPIP
jgi:hypothetical protein